MKYDFAIGDNLKIKELAKITGVSKDTIHYYLRLELLPKPKKKSKTQAEYDESYVERIRLIRTFQKSFFLPLPVIKQILKKNRSFDQRRLLELRSEYFRPIDRLLEPDIVGHDAYCKETGLASKWVERMESWGLITPEIKKGEKVYSQIDLTIGRLLENMDRIGMGPKDGFDPARLVKYVDMFGKIVHIAVGSFFEAFQNKIPEEELLQRSFKAREVMGVFFYLFYLKLTGFEYQRYADQIKELNDRSEENT